MSQEHPVDHEPRADDEQHHGWGEGDRADEHSVQDEHAAPDEHPVRDQGEEHANPFPDAEHDPDGDPTEHFAAQSDRDDDPTRQFDRVRPGDHQDSEPTQQFIPPPYDSQHHDPQHHDPQHHDPEPTIALPVSEPYTRPPVFSPRGFEQPAEAEGAGAVGFAGAGAGAVQQSESAEDRDARIIAEQARARAAEDENRRRRAAAEAARQRSLGTITPEEGAGPERPLPPRRSTDKWFGSLGIFVLRLVLAAILAIRGYQMITDIPATRDLLNAIGMPYLEYLPWALAIAHGLAALGLVFGLGVRVIGVCVAALAGFALALVKWGTVEIFQSGTPGFVGELEVLVAAVGFCLLTLGSGGWGMDAGWRHNRWRDKYGTQ